MATDQFTRTWITEKSIKICKKYDYGVLTLRGLHYQLVAAGMSNTTRHYKRVVGAMIKARRDGLVSYNQFSDHDRETLGATKFMYTDLNESIDFGKRQINAWMNHFYRGRWENQAVVPEVWIEKKALQGVFMPVCNEYDVALSPCKGYPSLTFLNDAASRFKDVIEEGRIPMILYFGDYDASGEDIPRSIQYNLLNDFGVDIEVKRIALMEKQVIEMGLPPAPTKSTDSRAAAWDGLGQVELDAVQPETLAEMARTAIEDVFDNDLYKELQDQTEVDRNQYVLELKQYVKNL
jgi:hypothetical protein